MATYAPGGGWKLVKTQYTLTESYVRFYTCPVDTYAVIGSIHLGLSLRGLLTVCPTR